MKNFKRGVCQLCVLFAALGVLLLAGALIEGTLPVAMILGGMAALTAGAEGVCRFMFFSEPPAHRPLPHFTAHRQVSVQPTRHAA